MFITYYENYILNISYSLRYVIDYILHWSYFMWKNEAKSLRLEDHKLIMKITDG